MRERDSNFWYSASGLFITIALLKGLRMPGSWARTQLQITYVHGFVKRGLLGQLLYLLHLRTLHRIEAFCVLQLIALLVLLCLFTWQSELLSFRRNPVLVVAFSGSYAITFIAHLIGYQDITLYSLALVLLLVRSPRLRFLLAVPVCVVALLIHENFLLCALPTILFSFIADRRRTGPRNAFLYAAAILTLCILSTVAIALRPHLSSQDLQVFKRETLARSPYPVDGRILDVVGITTAENVELNYRVIRKSEWWWAELGVAILNLGPLIALIVYSAWGVLHGRTRLAFLASSLSPLFLNGIAWDNVRWASLCALTAYINLGLISRAHKGEVKCAAGQRHWQAAVIVLGLGLASGHGLMDAEKVNPYPFFPPAVRPAVIRHDGVVGTVL